MFKFMNKVAHSYLYDVLGLIIVIGGCIASGYVGETLSTTPAWKSGSMFAHMLPAGLLIGLISIVSAVFSLESDRFESRLSNIGNWIGVPSILLTMFVDTMYGNKSAIITYPVTMIIQILAIYVWHVKGKYNVNKLSHGKFILALTGTTIASLLFSYAMNILGFGPANAHGAIFWTTTLAFAVSIIANLAEMVKLQFNNKAWIIYNLIQLLKSLSQGNFANVFKDIYYLGNNAVSIVSWSDKGRAYSKNKETTEA